MTGPKTTVLCGKSQNLVTVSDTDVKYVLNNNAWNYASYAGEQCIENENGRPNFRITKSLADSTHVMGYPNVSHGPSPWASVNLSTMMPLQLSSLPTIYSSWRTSQNAAPGSKWDTTYDLWCCSRWPGQQYRTAEIMIMLTYPGAPSGDFALIDGEEFLVRKAVRTNAAGLSWNMVQFRFRQQRLCVTDLNLTPFLWYTLAHGWATETDLLVQISAGFELWTGGRGLSTDWISIAT
jgi:hypothetical protein